MGHFRFIKKRPSEATAYCGFDRTPEGMFDPLASRGRKSGTAVPTGRSGASTPAARGTVGWSPSGSAGLPPAGPAMPRRILGVADSIEASRNLRDELVAQSWTSLFAPECGAAKLGLRLRM